MGVAYHSKAHIKESLLMMKSRDFRRKKEMYIETRKKSLVALILHCAYRPHYMVDVCFFSIAAS